MNEATTGREPVQIVEIVQPRCANAYGIAPCTASKAAGLECFNTRATCQDPSNYSQTKTLTWRFIKPHAPRLPALYSESAGNFESDPIPMLMSSTTSPTEVNIGGTGHNSSAFGVRASLSVTFQDAPTSDRFADPYLGSRSYAPLEQGTFWGKWLTRNPFHSGWTVNVYDGYRGQTLPEMLKRTYIIERISHPDSSGVVQLTAKDPLRLADKSRTLIPKPSFISLVSGISSSATSFDVYSTLAEVSATEYGATRYLITGDEILSYTGYTAVTPDVQYTLTGVVRGQVGTTATAHNAGNSLQQVARFSGDLDEILSKILFTSAGANIPASYYDAAAWALEVADYGTEFTGMLAYITDPTAADQLVSNLLESTASVVWWDDRAQKIEFQFIRPVATGGRLLTERDHILADTFKLRSDPERRLSRLAIAYNPYLPQEQKKQSDFGNVYIRVAAQREGSDQYGEIRGKTVLSAWIDSQAEAAKAAATMLNLLEVTPLIVEFALDAKDRDLWVGDVIDIEHRSLQDDMGAQAIERFFIISATESISGEVVQYKAMTYNFVGRFARIMADDAPDYDAAIDKDIGGWISDDTGLMLDSTDGYLIQ